MAETTTPAAPQAAPSTTSKKTNIPPLKRAAAVVIALGAERASEVYKFLSEDEIEQLSLEIAKLEDRKSVV